MAEDQQSPLRYGAESPDDTALVEFLLRNNLPFEPRTYRITRTIELPDQPLS